MSKERANVRLFVDHHLEQRLEIVLAAPQTHYLTRVMRLKSGDRIRLFNGREGEWLARITGVARSGCELLIETMTRAQQPEPGPALAFAPIKKEPMRVLVEKATELGVARLLPVLTLHTVAEQVNLDRMRAQVIEAAEQCGRLSIPEIAAPVPLSVLLGGWPESRPLLFLDERTSGRSLREAIAACAERWSEPPAPGILVGPEGGFSETEAASLRAHPCVVPVSLGRRILRAETAALAALACWQAFAGDWLRGNESD